MDTDEALKNWQNQSLLARRSVVIQLRPEEGQAREAALRILEAASEGKLVTVRRIQEAHNKLRKPAEEVLHMGEYEDALDAFLRELRIPWSTEAQRRNAEEDDDFEPTGFGPKT